MWILYSLGAAFFAGVTAIFSKVCVSNVNTNLATALRTTIILIFTILIVLFMSSIYKLGSIDLKTFIFLCLSGVTTALLWISYFKALSLADVNKVTPIDKTSTVITLILSYLFLDENITYIKIISIILIIMGTYLMVGKSQNKNNNKTWILYAILTAIFTSLSAILGKIGINNIDPNIGNLIRTFIVFIIIWIVVIFGKKYNEIKKVNKKDWIFIILSGVSTGLSWLMFFQALKVGEASKVFPIEKLSVVVAVLFSSIFLNEKLNKKSITGLISITLGILILII
jgi:transporter family protein